MTALWIAVIGCTRAVSALVVALLLADLGTLATQRVLPHTPGEPAFNMLTRPTPLQETALRLLNVRLHPTD